MTVPGFLSTLTGLAADKPHERAVICTELKKAALKHHPDKQAGQAGPGSHCIIRILNSLKDEIAQPEAIVKARLAVDAVRRDIEQIAVNGAIEIYDIKVSQAIKNCSERRSGVALCVEVSVHAY